MTDRQTDRELAVYTLLLVCRDHVHRRPSTLGGNHKGIPVQCHVHTNNPNVAVLRAAFGVKPSVIGVYLYYISFIRPRGGSLRHKPLVIGRLDYSRHTIATILSTSSFSSLSPL